MFALCDGNVSRAQGDGMWDWSCRPAQGHSGWQVDQKTKDGNPTTDHGNGDGNLRDAEADGPALVVPVALGHVLAQLGLIRPKPLKGCQAVDQQCIQPLFQPSDGARLVQPDTWLLCFCHIPLKSGEYITRYISY